MIDAPPDLVEKYLNAPATLVNLNKIEDVELKKKASLSVLLMALKHVFDEQMPYADIFFELGRIEDNNLQERFLNAIFTYILKTRSYVNLEELTGLAAETLSKGDDFMITMAEKLRLEGEKRVEKRADERVERAEEREKKNMRKVVANMIHAGFDDETICSCSGLCKADLTLLKAEIL